MMAMSMAGKASVQKGKIEERLLQERLGELQRKWRAEQKGELMIC
jgi:hypothetical protein